jgi:hypothetical protein
VQAIGSRACGLMSCVGVAGHGGMCVTCAHAAVEQSPHCCPMCRRKVLQVAILERCSGGDMESGLPVFACSTKDELARP